MPLSYEVSLLRGLAINKKAILSGRKDGLAVVCSAGGLLLVFVVIAELLAQLLESRQIAERGTLDAGRCVGAAGQG